MRMITLLAVLLIVALIYWVITTLGLPPMIQKVATIILVVFVCLWLIELIAPNALSSFPRV